MTPRPKRSDPAVADYAASLLYDHLAEHMPEVLEDEDGIDHRDDVEKQLASALRYENDGYEIAKALERHGWMPNADLVEDLHGDWSGRAYRKFLLDWVKAWNVKVPFATGDLVTAKLAIGQKDGVVYEVRPLTAEVVVNTDGPDHKGGYVVATEDVIARA